MSMDIFDHHDRIINEDSDREDQCEQRHPVQGKTVGPGGKQGDRQGDYDRHAHDQRLAPTHGQQHQQHHRNSGKNQLTY